MRVTLKQILRERMFGILLGLGFLALIALVLNYAANHP
jgi:tetrahydromethanopterin S-methyltransferase subunit B